MLSPTILPQLGMGSLIPNPRKLRPASAKMALGMPRASITISGGRAFGKRWVQHDVPVIGAQARARPGHNLARAKPRAGPGSAGATSIQLVTPMAKMTLSKPAPSTLKMKSANRKLGNALITSTTRMTTKSVQPPGRSPASAPSGRPTPKASPWTAKPTDQRRARAVDHAAEQVTPHLVCPQPVLGTRKLKRLTQHRPVVWCWGQHVGEDRQNDEQSYHT